MSGVCILAPWLTTRRPYTHWLLSPPISSHTISPRALHVPDPLVFLAFQRAKVFLTAGSLYLLLPLSEHIQICSRLDLSYQPYLGPETISLEKFSLTTQNKMCAQAYARTCTHAQNQSLSRHLHFNFIRRTFHSLKLLFTYFLFIVCSPN